MSGKIGFQRRWQMLACLFAVRTVMAFQFQTVAVLAPMLKIDFGVSVADIGFLIGIYLAPGIALALPGGAIGNRYGDKQVVMAGLALMICGGLVTALSPSWYLVLVGRFVAGSGGVLLNVLMSKMVMDWFARRENATAMAIFVNSWPLGIALALVVLPRLAVIGAAVSCALLLSTALVVCGMLILGLLYRAPTPRQMSGSGNERRPAGRPMLAVIVAGLIWGLFNGGFGMIFSFGPSMLHERGWSVVAASSVTSIVLWLVVISIPVGGILADRTQRHLAVLVGGLCGFAAMLLIAARTDAVIIAFVVLGLASGISAGPIMSLPARVLLPETRAVGMGVFYTLFYLVVVLAPWIGGCAASITGSSRVTFDVGAAMLLLCCAALWLFQRLARSPTACPLRLRPVRVGESRAMLPG